MEFLKVKAGEIQACVPHWGVKTFKAYNYHNFLVHMQELVQLTVAVLVCPFGKQRSQSVPTTHVRSNTLNSSYALTAYPINPSLVETNVKG